MVAAKALEIALTSRSKDRGGEPDPDVRRPLPRRRPPTSPASSSRASGSPSASRWRTRARAKGVVKREVVRVITPGTQLEASALDAGRDLVRAGDRRRGRTRSAPPGSSRRPASSSRREWDGAGALGAPARRDRRHPAARDPGARERRAARLARRPRRSPRPRSREPPVEDRAFDPREPPAASSSPTSAWSPSRPSAARRLPRATGRRRRRPPLRPRDPEARSRPT